MAISGDTVIVGAFREDTGGISAGAAYVFQRDQGGADNWGQVKKLIASSAFQRFGRSVAISGDTAVVGAYGGAGRAYVFGRNQGGADNWGQVKQLTASDAEADDNFGISVAVSGDTALVGALHLIPGQFGTGGAVYVFERDHGGLGNWGEVTKLTGDGVKDDDEFGASVAVSGNTAFVGARADNEVFAGAAYIFQRDQGGAGNWGEVKKLFAPIPLFFGFFGASVAVDGDSAVVGSVAGDGQAYVFGRDEGGADNWGHVTTLSASDAGGGDQFGWSVAISTDTVVVGAFGEDAGGSNAGAAYVFEPVPDGDGDGVADASDNCPTVPNPSQENSVHPGGPGDHCEDPDGDGVFDIADNCPDTANPGQENADGDQWGDACDNCPTIATVWIVPAGDPDCDGFTTTDENFYGTDPLAACAADGIANNEGGPDKWPVDLNDSQVATTADVGFMIVPLNAVSPSPLYTQRLDFNKDFKITTADVGLFILPLNHTCPS